MTMEKIPNKNPLATLDEEKREHQIKVQLRSEYWMQKHGFTKNLDYLAFSSKMAKNGGGLSQGTLTIQKLDTGV